MEIDDDEEMRSSPPPKVKREFEEKNELSDPIDPLELVDALTDMAVSRKGLDGNNRHCKMQRGTKLHTEPIGKVKDLRGSRVM